MDSLMTWYTQILAKNEKFTTISLLPGSFQPEANGSEFKYRKINTLRK